MPILTNHGRQRLAERVGADARVSAEINARKAYYKGVSREETESLLRAWVNNRAMSHRIKGVEIRLYRGYMYIFINAVLITVYPIPECFRNSLDIYMNAAAYDRYRAAIDKRIQTKAIKKEKKYIEKRKRFKELVLAGDIREYTGGKFSVVITGLAADDNLLSIHYIPKTRNVPDLKPLADYARECTEYNRVRLVHVKGKDGQRMYYC